jgi:hypothetical protein
MAGVPYHRQYLHEDEGTGVFAVDSLVGVCPCAQVSQFLKSETIQCGGPNLSRLHARDAGATRERWRERG